MHVHAGIVGLDALVFFAVADQHPALAQVIGERVDDFVVEEGEQLVPGVDQVHLDAQAAEDRRVLAADHPGPVDRDAARRLLQSQHGVAVDDARMRKIDVRRPVGARPRGEDESIGSQAVAGAVGGRDLDALRIHERRTAGDHVHVVALVKAAAQLDLAADHRLRLSAIRSM